ncbi:MAG TPA: helix-turn-helix domain-containing protein [Solirubrobacterales bacterium]
MAGSGDGRKRRDKTNHYRHGALWHPLRRRILRLMFDGREADAGEIAIELNETLNKILYHLRVLLRREALKATARGRPAPALYRWSPQAQWAREMLSEGGEFGHLRP